MIRKLFTVFLVAACLWTMFPTATSHAVSASDWNAGRIIDNNVFFNNNSMATADIQNFLNSQVPTCDTWGQQTYSSTQTRAQRGASKGYNAPYVCLKDYQENPTTHETNLATAGSVNGGWSAAQIIKYAADTYGVSPKALIVLLQKEQSIVTDDWPWSSQYRSATGYGCPDTAPCDAEYYGFYNQVTNAAAAFKRYAANPQNYRYKANQNNDILYNPSSSCGSSSVYLQNQATTGLYIYTPYQPNQAALNNLYGTGDACSAYGNRNFWRMYNDWFGPSWFDYGADYISANGYTDATKTTDFPANSMVSGQRMYMVLKFKNTGNQVWHNSGTGAVRVAVVGSASAFCDPTWLSCQRPAEMKEATVNPGETATFEFWYKAPTVTSDTSYMTRFGVVSETVASMTGTQQIQTTTVKKP